MRPPSRGVTTGITLFGCLWAFAVLYHQVKYRHVLLTPLHAGLTATAIVAMLRPWSVQVLGLLAGLTAATMIADLPAAYNHWFYTGLVSLALAAAGAITWWQTRAARADAAARLDALFAPAGRWCLVLLYAMSGFHKLNRDFFDAAGGCATVLTGYLGQRLGVASWLPSGEFLAWLTVLTELGLPLLLLVPRWRLAGVALGAGFHLMMGLAGYARFSATGLALLTLFMPWQDITWPAGGRVSAWWERRGGGMPRSWPLVAVAMFLGVAAAPGIANLVLFTATMAGSIGLAIAAGIAWRRGTNAGGIRLVPAGAGWAAMLGPVLVVGAGVMPYLGLGTERAFAMYSNLRTEGGTTNHLLMRAGQPFGFQRDLVVIESANVAGLQRLADEDMMLPFQEFRTRISEELRWTGAPVRVRFVRAGRAHDLEFRDGDRTLGIPVSTLARKFFRFRAVESTGHRGCSV